MTNNYKWHTWNKEAVNRGTQPETLKFETLLQVLLKGEIVGHLNVILKNDEYSSKRTWLSCANTTKV